jgi:hypothetical protein
VTLTLTQLTDLQRVRVALSSLALGDGTVRVERSATSGFQLPVTVRGGAALPVVSGAGQLDDYDWYADVENWFRVLPVDPPAGLLLDGASGAYASTPDDASLHITGDLTLRGLVRSADWASAVQTVVARWVTTGDQRSYMLWLGSDGTLNLSWSTDGTAANVVTATADTLPVPDADGQLAVGADLDVDNGASGWTVTFSTSTALDGQWVQLGDTVDNAGGGTTSVHAGTAPLEVGANDGGTADRWTGSIMAVEVRAGIVGTVVADPDFAVQDDGDTSFDDDAGLTWAVNGTALIIGPVLESDSITPSLAGRVWLKSVAYPSANTVVTVADHGDIEHMTRNGVFYPSGGSQPIGVTDFAGGRDHTLVLATATQAEEDHLAVMIRLGGIFFLHVPTVAVAGREGNVLLPGSMHVMIGRSRKHRVGGVSDYHHHFLPLTEVEAPPPEVVGTTVTVAQLVAVHGTLAAVWAAYPTLRDLWDSIGSVDDLLPLF